MADLRVTPLQGPPGQVFTFDGSHSYHLDPGRQIVQYTFNFGDATTYTETAASAPDGTFDGRTTHTYPDTYEQIDALPGDQKDYNVSLTVTDNSIPAKTGIDSLTVTLSLVNHKPVPRPGGPYIAYRYWDGTAWQGVPLTLNGAGSYDPDRAPPYYNYITSYEWELDAVTPYAFNDAISKLAYLGMEHPGYLPYRPPCHGPWKSPTQRYGVDDSRGAGRHPDLFRIPGPPYQLQRYRGPGGSVEDDDGHPASRHVGEVLPRRQPGQFVRPSPRVHRFGGYRRGRQGVAAVHGVAAPGFYLLRAQFDGSGQYLASSVQAPEFFLRVDKEATVVVYSGVTSSRTGQTVALQAQLKDDDGNAISGKSLSFTLGTQSAGAVTGAGGVGQANLALTQPEGTYTVATAFAGDTYYAAASDFDPFLINDPPIIVDVRVEWGAGRSASVLGKQILPWTNIRAIEVVFNEDVDVDMADLSLVGRVTGAKSFTNFGYSVATFKARWELSAPAVDWYMLNLDGDDATSDGNMGVRNRSGELLGVDYSKLLGVLPGDVNGNRRVDAQDVLLIRNKVLARVYDEMCDLDGDGDVDTNDMALANGLRNGILPPP